MRQLLSTSIVTAGIILQSPVQAQAPPVRTVKISVECDSKMKYVCDARLDDGTNKPPAQRKSIQMAIADKLQQALTGTIEGFIFRTIELKVGQPPGCGELRFTLGWLPDKYPIKAQLCQYLPDCSGGPKKCDPFTFSPELPAGHLTSDQSPQDFPGYFEYAASTALLTYGPKIRDELYNMIPFGTGARLLHDNPATPYTVEMFPTILPVTKYGDKDIDPGYLAHSKFRIKFVALNGALRSIDVEGRGCADYSDHPPARGILAVPEDKKEETLAQMVGMPPDNKVYLRLVDGTDQRQTPDCHTPKAREH